MPNRDLYLTVDVEPDCPPYLWTWRGITEGMPKLLSLLDDLGAKATFFTTGATAVRFPEMVGDLVARGHELACHGWSHINFKLMPDDMAVEEISRTNAVLRAYAPVTSFRAPYLSMPERHMPMLADQGLTVDASRGAYKWNAPRSTAPNSPLRIEASVTSSTLRLPRVIRNPRFATLRGPVTLFVHPWEFVDLTQSGIRYDCRFRTGDVALSRLRTALGWFTTRGYQFRLVRDFAKASV